jgi:hypothetical protein
MDNFLKKGVAGIFFGLVFLSSDVRYKEPMYSADEVAQIESFREDAELAMLSRILGKGWVLNKTVGDMLEDYSSMRPEVRRGVKREMEDSLFYLMNNNDGKLPESYFKKVRELGFRFD